MDNEIVKDIFDSFVNDKFVDAEEKLRHYFTQKRDEKIYTDLGLEKENPIDDNDDEE